MRKPRAKNNPYQRRENVPMLKISGLPFQIMKFNIAITANIRRKLKAESRKRKAENDS
jgi:hypothetical protein